MVGTGPMRDAFAGAVHLVSYPRPLRFQGRSTDLQPLPLETPQLGVNLPADFAWNSLARRLAGHLERREKSPISASNWIRLEERVRQQQLPVPQRGPSAEWRQI